MARTLARVAIAALSILYPPILWWTLTHVSARVTGLFVMGLVLPVLAFRLRGASPETRWAVLRTPIILAVLFGASAVTDDPRFVLALPIVINLVLLATFASSLRGVPMIERFARMVEPELGPGQVAHCRRWTQRWCVFFVANALVAAATLAVSHFAWALYNGAIAYGLMGTLFAGERLERGLRFPDERSAVDRGLARLFGRPIPRRGVDSPGSADRS